VEIILLKNISGLGALGDKVKVRPGYGRNYLVPGGFAVPATAANLEAFEARRAELEREAATSLSSAESRKAALEDMRVTIARKAGDEGRLFGSVGPQDIAVAITAGGVEVAKHEIRLPAGPLRATGEFEVAVHLHADVDTTITVVIVPEV